MHVTVSGTYLVLNRFSVNHDTGAHRTGHADTSQISTFGSGRLQFDDGIDDDTSPF